MTYLVHLFYTGVEKSKEGLTEGKVGEKVSHEMFQRHLALFTRRLVIFDKLFFKIKIWVMFYLKLFMITYEV